MTRRSVAGVALGLLTCLAGCTAGEDTLKSDFTAADLAGQGFVRDDALARRLDGRTIRVLGFVDHANSMGTKLRARFSVTAGAVKAAATVKKMGFHMEGNGSSGARLGRLHSPANHTRRSDRW